MAQGMQLNPTGNDLVDRFNRTYEIRAKCETCLDIEKIVCGGDYGATSWTTKDEANEIMSLLGLGPSNKLLDIGSGAGWPGLLFAEQTGCNATLTDLPFNGLSIAAERARSDGLADRVSAAVASGDTLPFRPGSFDAITHSDVLCCLEPKAEVLGSCRDAISDEGLMAFTVIYIAPGLSAEDHARAVDSSPLYAETPIPYEDLLDQSGWQILKRQSLSPQYMKTAEDLLAHEKRNEKALREVLGDEDYEFVIEKRNCVISAVTTGITCRDLFVVQPV